MIRINKFILFYFLFSIFIIMFDRLKIYPSVNVSVYRIFQYLFLFMLFIFLSKYKNIYFDLFSPTISIGLIFIFIIFLTIPFSENVPRTLKASLRLFSLIVMSIMVAMFLINTWKEEYLINIAIVMNICGIIAALSIITDHYNVTNFASLYMVDSHEKFFRTFGILGESNFAAGKLNIFLPFNLFLILHYNKFKKFAKVIFLYFGLIFLLIAVIFTGSRMGGIITFFTLMIFILRNAKLKRLFKISKMIKLMMALMVIIIIINIISLTSISDILGKSVFLKALSNRYIKLYDYIISNDEGESSNSVRTRVELNIIGLKMFLNNPLTGIGLGNYQNRVKYYSSYYYKYAHNTFMTILAETGIFGFLLFLGLLIKMGKQIYVCYRNSYYSEFYFFFGISFINLILELLNLSDISNKYLWGLFLPLTIFFEQRINKVDKNHSDKIKKELE